MVILKTLMLLALVVWVGGIIFFAFVVAPTLFHVLQPEQAGRVVSRSLTLLHWMGIVSAVIFLCCSLLYNRLKLARLRALMLVNVLVLVMLVLTLISQFGITPKMRILRELRVANTAPVSDNNEFDRLHTWSTRLEAGVLFLGLVSVGLTARRFS